MRKRIMLSALAAMLALSPAASAELRAGTAKDPVGDAQVAGIGFAQAKDIAQIDARYDRAAGDIVVDATMAGDVPAFGRHSYMQFTIEVRARGAAGCDGAQRVEINAGNSHHQGHWNRYPVVTHPSIGTGASMGVGDVRLSGRRIAFRANAHPQLPYAHLQTAALQNLDLTCVTVDVRGPGTYDTFTGASTLGPLYDRLDVPVSLRVAPPRMATPPVRVKRCPRVSLRGKTLKAARKALAKVGCSADKVQRPKDAGKRTLVVRSAKAADATRRVDLVLRVKR